MFFSTKMVFMFGAEVGVVADVLVESEGLHVPDGENLHVDLDEVCQVLPPKPFPPPLCL